MAANVLHDASAKMVDQNQGTFADCSAAINHAVRQQIE
jgi:hypothetical protein